MKNDTVSKTDQNITKISNIDSDPVIFKSPKSTEIQTYTEYKNSRFIKPKSNKYSLAPEKDKFAFKLIFVIIFAALLSFIISTIQHTNGESLEKLYGLFTTIIVGSVSYLFGTKSKD